MSTQEKKRITITDVDMPDDPPEARAIKAKMRDAWDRERAARAAMQQAAKEGAEHRRELAIYACDLIVGATYSYRNESGLHTGILTPHDDFHLFALKLINAKTQKPGKAILIVRHLNGLELVSAPAN